MDGVTVGLGVTYTVGVGVMSVRKVIVTYPDPAEFTPSAYTTSRPVAV